jgi:hypothetical protein
MFGNFTVSKERPSALALGRPRHLPPCYQDEPKLNGTGRDATVDAEQETGLASCFRGLQRRD